MRKIYVYVLDTLSDWELGYATAELNSGRYFRGSAERLQVVTVGATRDPITTLGGLVVAPDIATEAIDRAEAAALLLPGADTWADPRHLPIIRVSGELIDAGVTVAAICGSTAALAAGGLLDRRAHTSNALAYLHMTAPGYRGEAFYRDEAVVADGPLITANSAAALPFAREILQRLDVFPPGALEPWFNYYATGDSAYFFELLRCVSGETSG